jgi:hypothetical protein
MNTALAFSYTFHTITIDLFWVMAATAGAIIGCLFIGSIVGDLNEWFAAAAILIMCLAVELLLTLGSML